MWTLALALAASAAATHALPGEYQAVTETEYAIELSLETSGQARLVFRTWEADGSAPPSTETFIGSWSYSGSVVEVRFKSGQSALFKTSNCLSYSEFSQTGCSPGLRLSSTTFPTTYGLQRFGLWRSETLRVQP